MMPSTLTTGAEYGELAQSVALPGCLVASALGRYEEGRAG
jgi:hypothetical protein